MLRLAYRPAGAQPNREAVSEGLAGSLSAERLPDNERLNHEGPREGRGVAKSAMGRRHAAEQTAARSLARSAQHGRGAAHAVSRGGGAWEAIENRIALIARTR